ncbi:MAG: acyltransferase [Bacteroidales bacterium]|nr:acyltransferase [Bacteroidales bacterium]
MNNSSNSTGVNNTELPLDVKSTFLDKKNTNILRGIAILLVILAHVGTSFGNRYFTPLGGIGVAMFLFLSGYGLSESYNKNGLEGFFKKRFLRVLLPYFILIILYHIVSRCSFTLHDNENELLYIPRNWYIDYICVWYVVFFVTMYFLRKQAIIVMSIVSVAMFFIFNSNTQAQQSFTFLLGCFFSQKKEIFLSNKKLIIILSVISLVVGITALALKQMPFVRAHEGDIFMKICQLLIHLPIGFAIIMILNTLQLKLLSLLSIVGIVSYELYLSHIPFYHLIKGSVDNLSIFLLQTVILTCIIYFINKKIVLVLKR